jgi:hypothetical protein
MTIIYDHQNLFKYISTGLKKLVAKNQPNMDSLYFMRLLRMIWQIRKKASFNNTISTTLSLITVLFEDLFEAVNIQAAKCGEKEDPKPSITSLNKTYTCDGYDFNIDIINDDEYNELQNNC